MLALTWMASLCLSAGGQQAKPTEYDVKAAYLSNFGKFVQWPNTSAEDESFAICILGRDPFGASLDGAIANAVINGRRATARRISKAEEALKCRIVFISVTEAAEMKRVLKTLEKAEVLTVSDVPEFSHSGGMIQFVMDGNKVRFEVNLSAAQNSGLVLSSELLRVALTVRRETPSGG